MNNNKLIAEFMGVKPTILGDEITYEMYGVIDCIEDGLDEQHFFLEEELMFHTSWDWLMPVVHKIDEKCRERLGLNHSLHIGDDIDAVYHEVVEFIKEVNELTK